MIAFRFELIACMHVCGGAFCDPVEKSARALPQTNCSRLWGQCASNILHEVPSAVIFLCFPCFPRHHFSPVFFFFSSCRDTNDVFPLSNPRSTVPLLETVAKLSGAFLSHSLLVVHVSISSFRGTDLFLLFLGTAPGVLTPR